MLVIAALPGGYGCDRVPCFSIAPAREPDALFFRHPVSESSRVAVSPAKAVVGQTSGHTKRHCAPGREREKLNVGIFRVCSIADVPWQGQSQPAADPQQNAHPLLVSQRGRILSWPESRGWNPGIPPGAQIGGAKARSCKAEFIFLGVLQLCRRVFLFSLEKWLYLACILVASDGENSAA